MILADTSVWADHLRSPSPLMLDLLRDDQLVMHPFVIGELALGNLPRRRRFLADLRDLQSAPVADIDEVMFMIEEHDISGKGLGWVDINLLASTLLTPDLRLWSRDKRLNAVTARLNRVAVLGH